MEASKLRFGQIREGRFLGYAAHEPGRFRRDDPRDRPVEDITTLIEGGHKGRLIEEGVKGTRVAAFCALFVYRIK